VVCFATILVSAAIIISFAVSTTPTDVKAPLALSTLNSGEGLPAWGDDTKVTGTPYGQNLTMTDQTNYNGHYDVVVTVTTTNQAIIAADFAVSYSVPAEPRVAVPISTGAWTVSTNSMTTTILTNQIDTGTGYSALDQFTIQVNGAYTGVVFAFQAIPHVAV
jgi:hypothetical protein